MNAITKIVATTVLLAAVNNASLAGSRENSDVAQPPSFDTGSKMWPLPKPCVPTWQMPRCPIFPGNAALSNAGTDAEVKMATTMTVKGATGCIYAADRWGKPTGKPLSCPPYFVS